MLQGLINTVAATLSGHEKWRPRDRQGRNHWQSRAFLSGSDPGEELLGLSFRVFDQLEFLGFYTE